MASSGGRLAKQIIGMSNIEQLKAVEKVQKKMGFYQPQDFVHRDLLGGMQTAAEAMQAGSSSGRGCLGAAGLAAL